MPWAQHRQKMVKFQISIIARTFFRNFNLPPNRENHSRVRFPLAEPGDSRCSARNHFQDITKCIHNSGTRKICIYVEQRACVVDIFLFPTIWHQHTRATSECTYTIAVEIIDFFCRCIFLHFRNAALPLFHHKCCRGTVAETSFPRCGAWNEMCAASAVWRSFFAPPHEFLNQFDYNFSRKECSTAGDSF